MIVVLTLGAFAERAAKDGASEALHVVDIFVKYNVTYVSDCKYQKYQSMHVNNIHIKRHASYLAIKLETVGLLAVALLHLFNLIAKTANSPPRQRQNGRRISITLDSSTNKRSVHTSDLDGDIAMRSVGMPTNRCSGAAYSTVAVWLLMLHTTTLTLSNSTAG